MKALIAGASGGIGTRLAAILAGRCEIVAASRSTGIDIVSGRGLAGALGGVDVVIDVTNVKSRNPEEVLRYFSDSARNLTAAGRDAGVRHHIALSVVGADRMPESGYMRGKVAQEQAIAASGVPFTILRATQFFEFVSGFADVFANGDGVRVPDAQMQPIAGDDVAGSLATLAGQPPANAVVEIGGPRVMTIRDAVAEILEARGDRRAVTPADSVRYFGAPIEADTLVPAPDSARGKTDLTDWLSRMR